MIDRKILRDDVLFNQYEAVLKQRGEDPAILSTLRADEKSLRSEMTSLQEAQTLLNTKSRDIGAAMHERRAQDAEALKEACGSIKDDIARHNQRIAVLGKKVDYLLKSLPNWLDDSVPFGRDETDNQVVKEAKGELPTGPEHVPHWELDKQFGIDPEGGARLSGSRFTVLRGEAARLNRLLANYLLNNASLQQYEEVSTPVLVNSEAMEGTGQLPKFADDAYGLLNEDDKSASKYLIPTAEVSLTNLYRESITDIQDGEAIRMCALTPCFRREAGSAGRDTRGLLRQHQFEKVELVSICQAENAEREHEVMLETAEKALEKLGLKYRRVLLCSGDTGFSARKTYDLEVWMAGQREFREISSVSQCGDFQSRRMNARIRVDGGKPEFPHTLNGSALAVGRLLAAYVETHGTELSALHLANMSSSLSSDD